MMRGWYAAGVRCALFLLPIDSIATNFDVAIYLGA